jgi:endonuclease
MSIYEKSTNQLLTEYVEMNLKKAETIDKEQIISWFSNNYPKIKSNTVSCHIIKFTTNHKTRIHYNASPKNDLLFQLPNKKLRLYDVEKDPKPIYKDVEQGDDIIPITTQEISSEFAYESHLRDYLKNNLNHIEQGLKLYKDEEDESITGVEYDAGGKRIDILAVDSNLNFVIIELKVSRGYEKTVGQLLRYRAWVRDNLANGKKVRGVIIAKEISSDLKMAASEITGIELFEYDLKIDLKKI